MPLSLTLPTEGQTNWDDPLNTALSAIQTAVNANETAIAGKAATSHTHTISNVTGLQTALDGKAAVAHTHAIGDVTSLQAALDAKMAIPFADPNADRIIFWDDSAGAFAALQVGGALRLLGTQLDIPNAAAGTYGAIQVTTDAATQLGINSSDAVTPANLMSVRGRFVDINAQTGTTYTPVLGDRGKVVTLTNAAAITVTLPSDASVAFPIGTVITFAVFGAGMATFVAGSGANPIKATPSAVSRATNSGIDAIKVAANTWWLAGDLA